MEQSLKQALKGDKISHIYFIVRLVITCIGFIMAGFSLFAIGMFLGKASTYPLPTNDFGRFTSGLGTFIGVIGFAIVAYCVVVLAIGVAYSLVPILFGLAMKKKFLTTRNPKFIKSSLMLKCILLVFGVFKDLSLIGLLLSEGAWYLVLFAIAVLVADAVILTFTALGYSDACKAVKNYQFWLNTNQIVRNYN